MTDERSLKNWIGAARTFPTRDKLGGSSYAFPVLLSGPKIYRDGERWTRIDTEEDAGLR